MTCHDFEALDEQGQINALMSKGIYLAERKDNQCRFILYQLDSFYVEIIYGLKDACKQGVHIFDNTRYLEPYLDQVNIAAFL